ncbi:MAG: energy transducer TonB [Sphingomonadaceae bacterium]|nr:energy transducer TonB [Sphingomonadaceae bacterium]
MSVWMAETLIATTLLMALVMMVRRPVARWLGAGAAYMLWVLPFARMLLPTLPRDVVIASPLHVAVNQSGLPDMLAIAPMAQGGMPDAGIPWLEIAIGVWMVGLIAFLIVQTVGYGRFRRHMLDGATPLGEDGRIRIITSPHASGPLAFGVLRPYIVLPADFALRYDSQEQDMAIAHERAHHERGDLAANMIALLLLAVHWCNPVAWIAYRAYRADQETACDARVLALYGQDQAHAYGRAILKAAGGRQFAAACHLTRITTLKGRLKMLSTHETSLHRISWGMAAVAVVTATGLALTASGSRAAQQMAAITEKVEAVDLTRLGDLVTRPAVAREAAPAVPATPHAIDAPSDLMPPPAPYAPVPPAPNAPVPPAEDMIAPIPPAPPVPPVTVRTEKNRITVTHANGRVETHDIPTEADIARMVPRVDVRNGCEGNQTVSKREYVDSDGRRNIRIRICEAAIEAQANDAGQAGLRAARARVANRAAMNEHARAAMLRDMDQEIADAEAKAADREARAADREAVAADRAAKAAGRAARGW